MSAPAPASRHLLRWIALAIVAVLVALAVAVAIYVYLSLQPQRFTALLEKNLAAAGLRLDLQAPAQPTLFPRPGVQLSGFSLTILGSDTPVLQANGATIVVPWRALLHGEVAIERIDVDAPNIDIGKLETLLALMPSHAGPPHLPSIATGVQISDGTLARNGVPLLFDLSIRTGTLAPGQPFQLDASARTAAGRQFVASIDTVPSAAHDGMIDFNQLQVRFAEQRSVSLVLEGNGSWRGGTDLALQLEGSLRHGAPIPALAASTHSAPVATAATASAAGTALVTDAVVVDVQPAHGAAPMTVALKLDGEGTHVDMRLQPTEFGSWWNRLLAAKAGQPPGPLPFAGSAQVRQLDLGWLKATGISITADPGPAPSASSTPAPASATSAAH